MKTRTSILLFSFVAGITLLGAGCTNNTDIVIPPETATQPTAIQNNPTPQPIVKPYIKVIYPNGNEIFNPGQIVTIKWDSDGVDKIYLSMVNGGKEFGQIAENSIDASLKEYTWTVPDNFAGVESGYKIFISNNSVNEDIRDSSNGTFSIKSAPVAVQPFLKLTAPTGDQQFKIGQKVTISWTSSGVNKVYLSLVNGGKEFGQITENGIDASLGKYEWTVPDMSDLGTTGYKIFITNNEAVNELRDSSSVSFSIVK
ncbi:MAG: Ser-Thr-rich GPI-anchored membrane family protein [Candidatus Magasanikbacteria bacterium]